MGQLAFQNWLTKHIATCFRSTILPNQQFTLQQHSLNTCRLYCTVIGGAFILDAGLYLHSSNCYSVHISIPLQTMLAQIWGTHTVHTQDSMLQCDFKQHSSVQFL